MVRRGAAAAATSAIEEARFLLTEQASTPSRPPLSCGGCSLGIPGRLFAFCLVFSRKRAAAQHGGAERRRKKEGDCQEGKAVRRMADEKGGRAVISRGLQGCAGAPPLATFEWRRRGERGGRLGARPPPSSAFRATITTARERIGPPLAVTK